jgi:phosphoribosyl-AMP cyclohydrolase / phosphoribosyl-ATP pyrophosphohydrolase
VSVVELPGDLVYSSDGLLPVVAQDRASGDVLMVAWANVEAVRLTAETGEAHFWSRTRQRLWKKGESSGHILHVRAARTDCDRDTLLLIVDPEGPACHTGVRTCFGDSTATHAGVLAELQRVIAERAANRPEGSYTSRLLAKGLDHTLKKIGEEATEVVLAAKGESDERLAEESADLLFHLLVALQQRGLGPSEVLDVLARRRADMSKSKTS